MVSEKQIDAFHQKLGEFANKSIACFGPDADVLKQHFINIQRESDIGACVLCFSLIDDLVLNCLKSYMPNLTKAIEKRLFSITGPMGNASSRLIVAYSLGWMSQKSFQCIDKIRRIRNCMAHDVDKGSFNAPAIVNLVSAFYSVQKEDVERALITAAAVAEENSNCQLRRCLSQRDEFLIAYFALYARLIVELSVFPVSQRYNVPMPFVIGETLAFLPTPIDKQRREAMRVMLEAGLVEDDP